MKQKNEINRATNSLVDKKSSAEYYLDEIRRIWDHEFQSSFSYLDNIQLFSET